ncbi:hypothetical protein ACFWAP_00395 [Streptomyces goshikiensis]|uniref:hypothetical protein n=1 Tax=Streptomyces goshikiensis TaxID=1942 RepID=UPI00365D7699
MTLSPAPHATHCACGRLVEADEHAGQLDGQTICEICAAPDWDDDYAFAFDCT